MGSFSIWHWAIVLVVVALLFGGRGKLSGLMGDAAQGIKAFKNGLKDDDAQPATLPAETVARDETRKESEVAR